MTEKEAIEYLSNIKNGDGELIDEFFYADDVMEALDVAIKALEKQIKIKMLGKSYIIPKNGVWEVNGVDIHKAIEKQIPKRVELYIGQDMQCPVCNKRLRGYEGMKICYCKFCGQALER